MLRKLTLTAAATIAFAASAQAATPTVPQGVTLVEVVRELMASAAQVLWLRPGDADGRTLMMSDKDAPGVSKCVDACAAEFPPLVALANAKPVGDWTLVKRDDGRQQWAYQGHPLYTWTKEKEPGELATNVGLTETANLKLAETPQTAGSLMPPQGWQVARFEPAKNVQLPDGIDAKEVASALGVVLTNYDGFSLYAFDGDAKQDNQPAISAQSKWLPVVAPALAMNVGEFSVVSRNDGSKQWAFRNKPLYRFSGDLMPGDVHGVGVDKQWSVALLAEDFRPAGVAISSLEGYGDALSINGMTLYAGTAFQKYWGGRNLRDSFKNAYARGKQLGTSACDDAACAAMWKPFKAPADAKANGFWEPLTRADGSKQWAYKGYALYTYAGDKKPGENNGQATYAFAKLEGKPNEMERAAMLAEIGKAQGGAGVYWNVAKP